MMYHYLFLSLSLCLSCPIYAVAQRQSDRVQPVRVAALSGMLKPVKRGYASHILIVKNPNRTFDEAIVHISESMHPYFKESGFPDTGRLYRKKYFHATKGESIAEIPIVWEQPGNYYLTFCLSNAHKQTLYADPMSFLVTIPCEDTTYFYQKPYDLHYTEGGVLTFRSDMLAKEAVKCRIQIAKKADNFTEADGFLCNLNPNLTNNNTVYNHTFDLEKYRKQGDKAGDLFSISLPDSLSDGDYVWIVRVGNTAGKSAYTQPHRFVHSKTCAKWGYFISIGAIGLVAICFMLLWKRKEKEAIEQQKAPTKTELAAINTQNEGIVQQEAIIEAPEKAVTAAISTSNKVETLELGRISVPYTDKEGKRHIKKIALADIIYLKGDSSYTDFILSNGNTLKVSRNLQHWFNTLNRPNMFFRVNRSYIINHLYRTGCGL